MYSINYSQIIINIPYQSEYHEFKTPKFYANQGVQIDEKGQIDDFFPTFKTVNFPNNSTWFTNLLFHKKPRLVYNFS